MRTEWAAPTNSRLSTAAISCDALARLRFSHLDAVRSFRLRRPSLPGRRRAQAPRVVGHAVAPHRVEDPRQASRDRDDRDAFAPPRRDAQAPRAQHGRLLALRAKDPPARFDGQVPDARVAGLRDPTDATLLSPELRSPGTRPRNASN